MTTAVARSCSAPLHHCPSLRVLQSQKEFSIRYTASACVMSLPCACHMHVCGRLGLWMSFVLHVMFIHPYTLGRGPRARAKGLYIQRPEKRHGIHVQIERTRHGQCMCRQVTSRQKRRIGGRTRRRGDGGWAVRGATPSGRATLRIFRCVATNR